MSVPLAGSLMQHKALNPPGCANGGRLASHTIPLICTVDLAFVLDKGSQSEGVNEVDYMFVYRFLSPYYLGRGIE